MHIDFKLGMEPNMKLSGPCNYVCVMTDDTNVVFLTVQFIPGI